MTGPEYKNKRLELGYTQANLAHILKVSVTTVSRRERGEQAITREAEMALHSITPKSHR